MATKTGAPVREMRDDDAPGLIALVRGVFEEYACVFDLEGELPELNALATYFARAGGRGWVAEDAGRIVGGVGYVAVRPGDRARGIELRKLYVESAERGSGLGHVLCGRVEDAAKADRRAFVELWTDTRFTRAHTFYERRGYVRGPQTRELHDKSQSIEFHYRLDLRIL